jgi:multisubunit Na+/H+ antiporter MnhF subunit
MENIFIVASFIAFFYIIIKFIEMRIIEKQNIPLKVLIKDTLVVYLCVLMGTFIVEQINPSLLGESTVKVTQVFTDTPGF